MSRGPKSTKLARARFTLLSFTLFLTRALAQQPETGTITGTVRDASGTPLVRARVTLLSSGGLSVTSVTTGTDGCYSIRAVKDGAYRVTAEFPGSRSVSGDEITLTSAQTVVVDLTLAAGQASGSSGSAGRPGN